MGKSNVRKRGKKRVDTVNRANAHDDALLFRIEPNHVRLDVRSIEITPRTRVASRHLYARPVRVRPPRRPAVAPTAHLKLMDYKRRDMGSWDAPPPNHFTPPPMRPVPLTADRKLVIANGGGLFAPSLKRQEDRQIRPMPQGNYPSLRLTSGEPSMTTPSSVLGVVSYSQECIYGMWSRRRKPRRPSLSSASTTSLFVAATRKRCWTSTWVSWAPSPNGWAAWTAP